MSTAFIIESYKGLQPDFTAYIAVALYNASLSRTASGGFDLTNAAISSPSNFVVTRSSLWVNGLWFTSLVLSLSVAFLCILGKQWLAQYASRVSTPLHSTRAWARRHALYYQGLTDWHLPAFVSTLPVFMHLSLFSFLAGLVVFLQQFNFAIATWLFALSGVLLLFYSASFVMPIWHPACPSSTPLAHQLSRAGHSVIITCLLALRRLVRPLHVTLVSHQNRLRLHFDRFLAQLPTIQLDDLTNGRNVELLVTGLGAELDAVALRWLIAASATQEVVAVAVQAIGGLRPWSRTLPHLRRAHLLQLSIDHISQQLPDRNASAPHAGPGLGDRARYTRSVMALSRSDSSSAFWPDTQVVVSKLVGAIVGDAPYDLPLLSEILAFYAYERIEFEFPLNGACNFRACTLLLALDHRHCLLPAALLIVHALPIHHLSNPDLVFVGKRLQAVLHDYGLNFVGTWERPPSTCLEVMSFILTFGKVVLQPDALAAAAQSFRSLVRLCSYRHASDNHHLKLDDYPRFSEFISSADFLNHGWTSSDIESFTDLLGDMIRRDSTILYSVHFWEVYARLLRFALQRPMSDEDEWGSLLLHPLRTAVYNIPPAQRPHAHSRPALVILEPVQARGSIWSVIQDRIEDALLLTFTNMFATELCLLRRLGAGVTAETDELFRRNHFPELLSVAARMGSAAVSSLEYDSYTYRCTFEHAVQCCVELQGATWWPTVYDAVMSHDYGEDDGVVKEYATELNSRRWSPCSTCN